MKEKLTLLWSKINFLYLFLFYTMPCYCLNTFAFFSTTHDSFGQNLKNLIEEYNTELTVVLSVGMLLSIVIFIYHCVCLNTHSSNPQARAQDIKNLLITGVCLAGQGSVSAILAIVYFMFG